MAFVAVEMLCRILLVNGRINPVLYRLNRPSDSRNRLTWINDHPRGMKDEFGARSVYDPQLGWRTAAGLATGRDGGGLRITTDSNGFRQASSSPLPSTRHPRIVVLGDSFTFGDEVNDEESYPARLQQLLPETAVFNFGVVGYGHDQMLLQLQRYGSEYAPDIVILGFSCVDVWRNVLSFGSYAKPRFRARGEDLVLVNSPVPPPEEVLKSEKYRLKMLDLFQIVWMQVHYPKALSQEATVVTAGILGEIARIARSLKAVPIFVYLPDPHDMTGGEEASAPESGFANVCGEVERISVRPVFLEKVRKGTSASSFFKYYHYSPDGNRAVAEAIRDHLVRRKYCRGEAARR
jgi:hypothetical protein